MCVSRDTGKVRKDNDMRTNNPHIRRCDCVNHRILHPVQGLERDREGGEVRVMLCIRVCDISVSRLYKWALMMVKL